MNPITYPQEYTAEMHQYIESIEQGYPFNQVRYPLYVALLFFPLGIKGAVDGAPQFLLFIVIMYLLFLVFYLLHKNGRVKYYLKTVNKLKGEVVITDSIVRITNTEGFAIEHPINKCSKVFIRGTYYLAIWGQRVIFIPEQYWNTDLESNFPPISKKNTGYPQRFLTTDITWSFIIILTIFKLVTMSSEG